MSAPCQRPPADWRTVPIAGLLSLLMTAPAWAQPVERQEIERSGSVAPEEDEDEDEDAASAEGDGAPSQAELAAEAERAMDMFLREQKILFKQGEFEFELSFTNSADTQTNARLGAVVVPRVTQFSSAVSLLARFALTDSLEINLLVPASTRETSYDFGFLEPLEGLGDDDAQGLGDVAVGLRYQWLRETARQPDLAFSVDYTADTGEEGIGIGTELLSVSTTLVRTIDPVVFFAELGHEYSFENDGVDLGDAWLLQLGTGFSLNDRVSYNLRYLANVIGSTTVDGLRVRESKLNIASVQFGVTVQLSRRVFLEPSLSMGLTDDATDMVLGLSVPF